MRARLVVYLLALLAGAASACADDTAVQGVGGAMQPMKEHPSVVMEAMDVSIGLTPQHAAVHCTFAFHNTGPGATVRMGFPERGNRADGGKPPIGFSTFQTWVDGKEVRAHTEGLTVHPEGNWHRWRVKRVRFAANQTRRVEVDYRAPLGAVSDGSRFFRYDVSTGSSWKGPIGSARVTIAAHYDPGRAEFHIGPAFRKTGADTYEWTATQIEPTSDDDVSVTFLPGFRNVTIGFVGFPPAPWSPGTPPYPYLDHGVFWTPVRYLATWLGAEVHVLGPQVVLARGPHAVKLFPGSRSYEWAGHPYLLSQPTRVENGRLLVPAATIAPLLGVEMWFDPEQRAVRMNSSLQQGLESAFDPDRASRARTCIPAGWAPPEPADYPVDLLAYVEQSNLPAPWYCAGDFNGDRKGDIALFLRRGLDFGIGLVESAGEKDFRFVWLEQWPRAMREPEGGLHTILQTTPPGIIQHWAEGETTQKSGRLDLKHDGVEVIAYEKAAVMYYWDEASQRYLRVITAD